MDLIIFGAQGYALGAYDAIRTMYPQRKILCFLVSQPDHNASSLAGIPVKEIGEFSKELGTKGKESIQILIATPENVHEEIEETLENHGFHCYSRLDSARWMELAKMFHVKSGRFLPLGALPVGYHSPFIRIYMAKSHKDRSLKNNPILPSYILPLQVGAVGCDIRIADISDDKGVNISQKNGNYSELTGLYWIWKNKLVDPSLPEGKERLYYGLVQYRRMLEFTKDDLLRLVDNNVDVVLPYPLPYEPDIQEHHKRYLKEEDWQALLTTLRQLQPEYADVFPEILGQRYLYNYNVILAKKEVLRAYCEWLFPILERTEELSVPKGCGRADRYIGYMAETLETLYFMKNAGRLNIVHTGCRLYC